MAWEVLLHPLFAQELLEFPIEARREVAARIPLLMQAGPQLGRPQVDTLKGSKHANMKELRFYAADGVWRVAFAFDPKRKAVLLVGGDKSGVSEKKFYKALIRLADARFSDWLGD